MSGLIVVLVCISLAAPAVAQTPLAVNLGIDQFGVEDGLPGLFVSDLEVTDDGRLWMLASGQVVSFDGVVFETHPLGEAQMSFRGRPLGIGAGRGDTLWVTVEDRLYSHVRGRTEFRAEYGDPLRDVIQEESGTLWAWTTAGAARLGAAGFEQVIAIDRSNSGTPAEDGTVEFWDASGGLPRRVAATWLRSSLWYPDAWEGRGTARAILVARRSGSTVEVTRADGTRVAVVSGPLEGDILLEDHRGLLWTAPPGGVRAFAASGDVVASFSLGPDNRVTRVREDREGNLWLGTLSGGLFRVRERPIRVMGSSEGVTDGQVASVTAAGGAGVFVLDALGNVYRVIGTEVDTVFASSEGRIATGALIDRRGTLWIGLIEGPRRFLWGRRSDGGDLRIELPRWGIGQIVEDPEEDGVLWIGDRLVNRVRAYAETRPIEEAPIVNARMVVRDRLVNRRGVVWLAGPLGVIRVEGDVVQRFLASEGYPTGNARALLEGAHGEIWIGRYFGGLVRFRDGRFESVRGSDGLWEDVVSGLTEDDAGNFWMAGNRGVHRVAREEVEAFLAGRVDRVHGRGYGASEGFRNPETSGGHVQRSSDGRLWFPTLSGVAVVDPAEVLAQEQLPPRVRLVSLQTEDERLRPDAPITLPRGQRRFDVTFGAIALGHPEAMRYEVRLEGVDPDWVDVGGQRRVTYGNVPPGRRAFRVRAINGAGVPSANEASVLLTLPPYFHETGTFLVMLALVAAAVMMGAFDWRVRRLRAREATLRRLVRERTHDLAESRARAEDALSTVAAQAEELRSLDEAKSRFFANVSHELRTPLTLVKGPLQDVLDGRLGPTSEAVRGQLETVLGSGRRLGELVEQLLDVARLEAGELRLDVRVQDVRPLLERIRSSFGALGWSRGISLEMELPEGRIFAAVDADQIEKVYANLLSNALKFTPAGGSVRVAVEFEEASGGEGWLVVSVEDDGPGVPEEEWDRIFERFHQVNASDRRFHGGTGLGLALVKEISELHGGTVFVDSGANGGCRFTVRLPVGGVGQASQAAPRSDVPDAGATGAVTPEAGAAAEPESAAARTAPDTVSSPEAADESDVTTEPDAAAEAVAQLAAATVPREASVADESPAATTDADADRPTVLVVEDHDELRAYLRRHLEQHYRVLEASDGREGLAEARRVVPDLILCDVMMPAMDGDELCREIRADPELDFLPVIMVTAKASRESRLSALEGGADDYLVKPFDPEELRLRVANVLAARRRLEQRLREEGKALPLVALDFPVAKEDVAFTERIGQVLVEHMGDEDFDAEAMAKKLAMSRATLYRKTGDALGISPAELLWRFRLRQAANLLEQTDATVSEVAYACGFKTVPHFTRRFKALYGTTPAAFRG